MITARTLLAMHSELVSWQKIIRSSLAGIGMHARCKLSESSAAAELPSVLLPLALVCGKENAASASREQAKRVSHATSATGRAGVEPSSDVANHSTTGYKCRGPGATADAALALCKAEGARGGHHSNHRNGEGREGKIPRLRQHRSRDTFQARAAAADALRADFLAGTRRRGPGPRLSDWRRARR